MTYSADMKAIGTKADKQVAELQAQLKTALARIKTLETPPAPTGDYTDVYQSSY